MDYKEFKKMKEEDFNEPEGVLQRSIIEVLEAKGGMGLLSQIKDVFYEKGYYERDIIRDIDRLTGNFAGFRRPDDLIDIAEIRVDDYGFKWIGIKDYKKRYD